MTGKTVVVYTPHNLQKYEDNRKSMLDQHITSHKGINTAQSWAYEENILKKRLQI